jgi:hypothetical protein
MHTREIPLNLPSTGSDFDVEFRPRDRRGDPLYWYGWLLAR